MTVPVTEDLRKVRVGGRAREQLEFFRAAVRIAVKQPRPLPEAKAACLQQVPKGKPLAAAADDGRVGRGGARAFLL
jgi:hypothetical protein